MLQGTFGLVKPKRPLEEGTGTCSPLVSRQHISNFAVYFTLSYLECRHVHAALAALEML